RDGCLARPRASGRRRSVAPSRARTGRLSAEIAEHLGSDEPDQRGGGPGALRRQTLDVKAAHTAFLERYRSARANQMRRELAPIRFVADERDAALSGHLADLRHDLLRRMAWSQG